MVTRTRGRPPVEAPLNKPLHLRLGDLDYARLTAWAASERRPVTQLLALIVQDALEDHQSKVAAE